ncbi:nitroreductase family protein [Hydrogenivirga sp. 128-5-R1-1]|uniref:nitroreductase family protein n=1 Tax=Hydrogenivirga sp. 128-5-R1-1 TaxID=392423 RepID=UPI00015EF97D|nr:nitroreductase family protein [Hydrogenivirga sp. 128-5-R1-1]EDP75316.1 Nitroreductase [Hydrogenivirga sp. 128-5-R1-1]
MGDEKRGLREEARELFKLFFEKSKDVQKATAQTIKEITDKTLKEVQPSKEKVKEITEGILEGIQDTRKEVGGRLEGVIKTLQELTERATSTVREVITGVVEGVEEVSEKEKREECLKYIKERRSVTFFDPDREVPDEVLKDILNIAALAPSGYNLQPWEVIVVKSRDKKKKLREICYNQEKVEEASANIVIIANTNAAEEHVDRVLDSWVELGYIKEEERDSLRETILAGWKSPERRKRKAIRDSALFAMSVMIVARYFGLETHPMEGFDEAKLKRFLGIGRGKLVPLIVAIGYRHPEKELLPRAYRFKFEEFGKIV